MTFIWVQFLKRYLLLTHWGRVMHICVSKQTIIGSDNGLSPGRRQAIIWTNAGILLIGPPGTNFSEISIKILTFSFVKIRLKVSSAKWRPFCLGLNVLITKISLKITFLKFHSNLLGTNELTPFDLVMWHWIEDLGEHWWHPAITWTSVDLSSTRPSGAHLCKVPMSKETSFLHKTQLKLRW